VPDEILRGGEEAVLERFARWGARARIGEVWSGDDAAVLTGLGAQILVSTDALVEGVHFRRTTYAMADIAWKTLAVNLSDIAAMGGRAHAVVLAVTGASGRDLELLADGLDDASLALGCPVVGGDVSDGDRLTLVGTVIGIAGPAGPVLRSGARPGEMIFVTGPLGRSAAGLRQLEEDAAATGLLVEAHRRPTPRLAAGAAAASAGATAMIDISDGLSLDLDRLARASRVGVALETVPVADGASIDDALSGGEDYELAFTAPNADAIFAAFADAALPQPVVIGAVVADASRRTIEGRPFRPVGFVHGLG
jgi:thiamine-monophosphate kinase